MTSWYSSSFQALSLSCYIICIGNSMISSDIWHKYHKWYFKIVIRNLRQFWNITSGIYAKYHIQIMLLFVYTTTRKRFVIFTCRYFKLSWNTTTLSQSNCSNFSCSSIKLVIKWAYESKLHSSGCFGDVNHSPLPKPQSTNVNSPF